MAETIELETAGSVTLRGHLERRGPYWTVLVHDLTLDLDSLAPLADALLRAEFTVLRIDLRGHGLSDGAVSEEATVVDVGAAVDWCCHAGAGQLFAAAAGRGAAGVLGAPADSPIAAAVLLTPSVPSVWLDARIRHWAGPKLFIVGSGDVKSEREARLAYDACIGPRLFSQLPTSDRSHELLLGDSAVQVLSQSVGYFVHHRSELERAA